MACKIVVDDPSFEDILIKHKGDFQPALRDFIENYNNLKAPVNKNILDRYVGKIVLTRTPIQGLLPKGIVDGTNLDGDRIRELNKRGFTIAGNSPIIESSSEFIVEDQNNLVHTEKSLVIPVKQEKKPEVVFEPTGTSTLQEDLEGIEDYVLTFLGEFKENVPYDYNEVASLLQDTISHSAVDTFMAALEISNFKIVFTGAINSVGSYKNGVIYLNPLLIARNANNIILKEIYSTSSIFSEEDLSPIEAVFKLILAHETAHAITSNKINIFLGKEQGTLEAREKSILRELQSFYNKNKHLFGEEITDFHEFVSRSMTSPMFMLQLESFKYNKDMNFFEKIIELIVSLFSSNTSVKDLVEELLLLNRDTNRDTLHETEEEYFYTGTTLSTERLLFERSQNIARLANRTAKLRSQRLEVTRNTKLLSTQKLALHSKMDSEIHRLERFLEREKGIKTQIEGLSSFVEYEETYAPDYYHKDVVAIRDRIDKTKSLLTDPNVTVVDLQNALEDLQDAGFSIAKWKNYGTVTTDEDKINHKFAPVERLKMLEGVFIRPGVSKLTDLYGKYYAKEALSLRSSSGVPIYISREDNVASMEGEYNILLREIVKKMINSDKFLIDAGVPQKAAGIIVDDATFLELLLDVDALTNYVGTPGTAMTGEESVLARVLRTKMNEIDTLAINEFHELTTSLSSLYNAAVKEAKSIGEDINELFRQTITLARETFYTGNLIEQYSEQWKEAYRGMQREHYSNIKYHLGLGHSPDNLRKKLASEYRRHNADMLSNVEVFDLTRLPEIIDFVSVKSIEAKFTDPTENGLLLGLISPTLKPADTAYRSQLINEYGKELYDKTVKKQQDLIEEFFYKVLNAKREIAINEDSFMAIYDIDASLRGKPNDILNVYSLSISPFHNHDVYYGKRTTYSLIGTVNSQLLSQYRTRNYEEGKKYISFVPRKTKANVTVSLISGSSNYNVRVVNTTTPTNFYDTDYGVIESNPAIKEYYDKYKEVLTLANSRLSHSQTKYLSDTSLPLTEMGIWEYLIKGEGSTETGLKYLYSARIRPAMVQLLKNILGLVTSQYFQEISKYETVKKSELGISRSSVKNKSEEVGRVLTLLLEENPSATPAEVQRLKYYAYDLVAKKHSADLHKIILYHAKFMVMISHKQNSVPLLDSIFELFSTLKKPKVNRQSKNPMSVVPQLDAAGNRIPTDELRTSSVNKLRRALEIWKYHPKHVLEGVGTSKILTPGEKELAERLDKAILTARKTEIKELLIEWRNSLNRVEVFSKWTDGFIGLLRLKGLAISPLTAFKNILQGYASNFKEAASGKFFTNKNMSRAYGLLLNSFLSATTFKIVRTDTAKKITNISKRFDFLQDMTDEVEKAASQSNVGSVNPIWFFMKRTEYINQMAVFLAILDNAQITDDSGRTTSLFDALDVNGNIKDEYSNAKFDWNNPKEIALLVKAKAARDLTQGDYTDVGSGEIKSSWWGRIMSLYQTWIGSSIFTHYAKEQYYPGAGMVKGHERSTTLGHKAAAKSYEVAKNWINPYTVISMLALGPYGVFLPGIASSLGYVAIHGVHAAAAQYALGEGAFIDKNFAKDFFKMHKAILQRTLRKAYLQKSSTIRNQFSTDKDASRNDLEEIDKGNLRQVAEKAAMINFIMILSALLIIALFDRRKKVQDAPLFNLLTNVLDAWGYEQTWLTTLLTPRGMDDSAMELASNPGSVFFGNVTKIGSMLNAAMFPSEDSRAKSGSDRFMEFISPSGYNQMKGATEAYRYGIGLRYPYDKIRATDAYSNRMMIEGRKKVGESRMKKNKTGDKYKKEN